MLRYNATAALKTLNIPALVVAWNKRLSVHAGRRTRQTPCLIPRASDVRSLRVELPAEGEVERFVKRC